MNTIVYLGLMFLVGLLVGLGYFGGLWLTVSKIQQVRHPKLLMFGSLVIRLGVTLFIFYLVAQRGYWQWIIACLLGFLIIRIILVRYYQPPPNTT